MRMFPMSVGLLAFATSTSLFAGGDESSSGSRVKDPRTVPEYCKLSDVIGAKVSMAPGAEAVEDAKKEGDTPARPSGKVDDLLVDSCNGAACWTVITFDKTLGFGGKTVVVPCDQLNWNVDKERFDLRQSDEQLKALPSFDVGAARKKGFDACCADLKAYWPTSTIDPHHAGSASHAAGDGDKEDKGGDDTRGQDSKMVADCPAISVDGKSLTCAAPQLILASDLHGAPVFARGEKFGKIDTTIVDRANHGLAYYIVTHGGTLGVGSKSILVPVTGICLHQNGNELAYSVDRSVSELETAVEYKKPEHGVLGSDQAARVDAMFEKDIQKHCDMTHP